MFHNAKFIEFPFKYPSLHIFNEHSSYSLNNDRIKTSIPDGFSSVLNGFSIIGKIHVINN